MIRILLALLILCAPQLSATESRERLQEETAYLLDAVANSGCIFDRNGKRHQPAEAVRHIQRKADYFEDEIDSAERFIELSASRSTMSRKPYYIECPGEPRVESSEWLLRKLSDYRQGKAEAS